MTEKLIELSTDEQRQCLELARQSIVHGLNTGHPPTIEVNHFSESLQVIASSFVTLTKHSQLRGCIGSLVARIPLIQDINEHAYAAAFRDPRFPALQAEELSQIHIEISVLTPEREISFIDERDLLQQLRSGIDGLTIKEGHHHATFLPSVWHQLPNKEDFLNHLKRKAGLPSNYWSNKIKAYRYSTASFEE